MNALRLAHLGLLCAWGGLLLAEIIIESLGEDDVSQAHATRLHFWIDLLAEVPIVLGVLVTGGLLLAEIWPPTWLHLVKVACALVAIGMNLYCSAIVVVRYFQRDDMAAVRRWGRHVRLSVLGVPFGAVAAYIGLVYFT